MFTGSVQALYLEEFNELSVENFVGYNFHLDLVIEKFISRIIERKNDDLLFKVFLCSSSN